MLNGIVGFSKVNLLTGAPVKQIIITDNNISITASPKGKATNNANQGIYLATDFQTHSITNCTISNMLNGIVGFSKVNLLTGAPVKQIIITDNNISITASPKGKATNNANQGIYLENQFAAKNQYPGWVTPWIQVKGNILNNVFNGIIANNFWSTWTNVEANTINLQQADNQLPQFGISESQGNNNWVVSNIVTNTALSNDNGRGIYTASSWAPVINCNTVSNIGRGFEFYGGVQNNTNWLSNTMTKNGKGFVLNNTAIGNQTNLSPSMISPWAASNIWTNGLTDWTGLYHTYTISSLPSNSPLYVLFGANPDLTPSSNWGAPFSPATLVYKSTPPYNGIVPASSLYPNCLATWRQSIPPMKPQPPKRMIELIAQDSISYGVNEDRNRWMAQFQLYRALAQDTTLQNSCPILQSFYTAVAGTRYEWLTEIEDSLAIGADTSAANLLATMPPQSDGTTAPHGVVLRDGLAGDSIIANYVAFFNLYMRWNNGSFVNSDSISLAGLAVLCPHLDGAIIYQARTLRHIITHDFTPYYDLCDGTFSDDGGDGEGGGGGGGGEGRMLKTATSQSYILSPNPNDGNILLLQSLTDKSPVGISVSSVLGQIVYQSSQIFDNRVASVHLTGLAPGLYYISLHDISGSTYNLKTVKQ